jgi:hypothetical protein
MSNHSRRDRQRFLARMTAYLVATIVLAGCAGAAEPADASEEDALYGVLETDKATGAIRGVIVDETIRPLAAAHVELLGTGETTETNAEGGFGFSRVAPGPHGLRVSKPGYDSTEVVAYALAGEKSDIVKVTLAANPATALFVSESVHTGFIWCAYMIQSVQNCDLRGTAGQDDNGWYADVESPPQFLQSEFVWASNQQLGTNLMAFVFSCTAEAPCGIARLCQIEGASPIVCKASATEGSGAYDFGLNASGVGLDRGLEFSLHAACTTCSPGKLGFVFEQSFSTYTHLFYNFEPDADWHFSRDGSPIIPRV